MAKTAEELEAELERLRKQLAGEESNENGETSEEETNEDETENEDNGEANEETNEETENKQLTEEEIKVAALKESLNKLDKKLKEEAKARAAAEKKLKDAEIERLRSEGKEAEALKAQMEQLEAELAVFRDENTALKRDRVLDDALSGVEFRNDRSRAMARREIVENLTQDENGSWVSKDGSSIDDYVTAYTELEDNSFLFKQKTNRGSQSQPGSTPNTGDETPKSILDVPQDQFMKQIEKKLRSQGLR
ncbi:hypothetical protein KNU84_gp107 [Bacteriophage DSS3_VP1]|uniref:Scaffolding protein n=1 Tax=Bacteriophage DSS3_VP1 TaxID=2664196 RepID=A0A7S5KRN1_9CAUD|nr:hypothetical protein KNU84_gp107 [Bacteriophage DSS3_VP1]QGH74597.1 hypothetical protein DSS3VP1_00029 [Bacteriophage DSS3_VP1]